MRTRALTLGVLCDRDMCVCVCVCVQWRGQAMHRIHKFSKEITMVSGEIATGNFKRVGTMLPVQVHSPANPAASPRHVIG